MDHIKITACIPSKDKIAIVDTINQITFNTSKEAKAYWAILNSKLINWYVYRFIFAKAIRTMHFDNSVTARIPINIYFDLSTLENLANNLIELYELKRTKLNKFLARIESSFTAELINNKIRAFF
ncbi:MAG: hypothetical protein IPF52_18245 [Saprospiraceae bacterium]|nr:hypothetical protein [Saprospiraceae bacterium]